LDFDSGCAEQYGQLRAQLLDTGTPVDPRDLMIASTALHHNLTVVTHNLRHFEVIPGLRVENWLSK
ncbi:MAG TPA: type II toxin-antitoxin system VapC family toxin, partial [Planctomycetaceae bacterium]|nr:type II toxin-antitoxin system VapC family toxin [Planctomycetaceae bacterium]